MPTVEFIIANPVSHKNELLELNIEYLTWVCKGVESHFGILADEVVGMPAADYVPTVIDKVCGAPPPEGVFYLVKVDGGLAGMGERWLESVYANFMRFQLPQYIIL